MPYSNLPQLWHTSDKINKIKNKKEVKNMKKYILCSGPGPNPECPALVINEDGSVVIGEEKEGVGVCRLSRQQFEALKKIIKSI